MPEIKIKIGAAVDQSMRTVFKPLVQAAIDARKQVQKEFASVAVGMKGSFTDGGRAARRAFADTTRAGDEMSRELANQAKRRTRAAEQESKAEYASAIRAANEAGRERIRILNANNRLELQAARQLERDKARAAESSSRAVNKFADRTSHRATRFLMPNMPIASMARRAGSEVLQGLGVDTSISGLVSRGVNIESAATALSNQGHIEGDKGANGRIVDASVLSNEARGIGAPLAVNPEQILKAQSGMVALTGDLQLAREIMPDLVSMTAAIGGGQVDAAKAAGEFAAAIGDVPNKAERVLELMRVLSAQGKKGAIDLPDFAKYAARAASAAPMFEGDKVENISKLTALAQIAKQHGGASSAAEAFTGIASLMGTLSKPARFKSIAALTGDKNGQFTDEGRTKLMDPFKLLERIIVSAKGDIVKINAAIGDQRSGKLLRGLAATYNDTVGGKTDEKSMTAGLKAMQAELAEFKGITLSKAEIDRANGERLKTAEARAEQFGQKLEAITNKAMVKLLPALEKLEVPALNLAGHLGDLAAWVATNPGTALIEAVGLVIARAGLESAFRHGIETIIKNVAGTSAIPGKGGMVGQAGGIAGLFTSAVVIGALAYAIEQAGEAAIAHFFNKRDAAVNADATQTGNDAAALANATNRARKGEYTDENKAALEKAVEHTKKKIEEGAYSGDVGVAADPMGADFGGRDSGTTSDSKETIALKAELAKMTALLDAIKNGQLKVHVTNMPPPDMPKAPVAGGG